MTSFHLEQPSADIVRVHIRNQSGATNKIAEATRNAPVSVFLSDQQCGMLDAKITATWKFNPGKSRRADRIIQKAIAAMPPEPANKAAGAAFLPGSGVDIGRGDRGPLSLARGDIEAHTVSVFIPDERGDPKLTTAKVARRRLPAAIKALSMDRKNAVERYAGVIESIGAMRVPDVGMPGGGSGVSDGGATRSVENTELAFRLRNAIGAHPVSIRQQRPMSVLDIFDAVALWGLGQRAIIRQMGAGNDNGGGVDRVFAWAAGRCAHALGYEDRPQEAPACIMAPWWRPIAMAPKNRPVLLRDAIRQSPGRWHDGVLNWRAERLPDPHGVLSEGRPSVPAGAAFDPVEWRDIPAGWLGKIVR